MASNTRNVKLGVCKIFFDGVDLGYTKGGVEVNVATETYKVEVDQFGKSAINDNIQGRTTSVVCPLAETTLANLVATMPGATLVSDGARATGTITFTAKPITLSLLTIGAQVFTFTSSAPTGVTQIKIGADLAATLENAAMALNSFQWAATSTVGLAGGIQVSVNALGTALIVKAVDPGVAGNAITTVAGTTPLTNATTGATLLGGVAETRSRVDVGTGVGVDMLSIAKMLRLHPISKAETDFTDDFVLYRAASAGNLQFSYKVDSERIYNVTFNGYPDPNSPNARVFSIGDPFYQP